MQRPLPPKSMQAYPPKSPSSLQNCTCSGNSSPPQTSQEVNLRSRTWFRFTGPYSPLQLKFGCGLTCLSLMLPALVIPEELIRVPSPSQTLLRHGNSWEPDQSRQSGREPTARSRSYCLWKAQRRSRLEVIVRGVRLAKFGLHIPQIVCPQTCLPFVAGETRNSVCQAVGGCPNDRTTVGQNAFWYKAAWPQQ